MARLQSFARDVQLATAGIAPGAIQQQLAAFARSELSAVIQSGEGSPFYNKYVNGRLGADESTVIVPGPIVYDFIWWQEVGEFALQSCVERSPLRSGRYRSSWFILANGRTVTDLKNVQPGATLYIVNTQPYSRKLEVGHRSLKKRPGVVENVARSVNAIWGNMIRARATMIELPSGPAPAPYTLKGKFRRGIRPFARKKLRPDTQAGAIMKYPALRLEMRT